MEKRVLELKEIGKNNERTFFRITKQSHRGPSFAKNGGRFSFKCFLLGSTEFPFFYEDGQFAVRGGNIDHDDDIISVPNWRRDGLLEAVKAYNDTNGGFGFDNVCPTCGQEIKEWRPKTGEEYFFISTGGEYISVVRYAFCSCTVCTSNLRSGNYFKTRELAEQAVEKVKEALKNSKHS